MKKTRQNDSPFIDPNLTEMGQAAGFDVPAVRGLGPNRDPNLTPTRGDRFLSPAACAVYSLNCHFDPPLPAFGSLASECHDSVT